MTPTIRTADAATLEAIYNLNKHAKKYAGLASKNYRRGKKATAHANSLKKEALYTAKTKAINRLLRADPDALTAVERHPIDGSPFLCLYFEDEEGDAWSFHQPIGDVATDRIPDRIEIDERDAEDFEEFGPSKEKERSDRSLKASLLHLEALGINVNELLRETHVDYGLDSHFVGWTYLGDGGERMTPTQVDDEEDDDVDTVVCEECGKECKGEHGLAVHQALTHDEDDTTDTPDMIGPIDERREGSRLEVDDPNHCKRCGWELDDDHDAEDDEIEDDAELCADCRDRKTAQD